MGVKVGESMNVGNAASGSMADSIIRSATAGAAMNMVLTGFVSPAAWVVARLDPKTKERGRFIVPFVLRGAFSPGDKDRWDAALRKFISATDAEAICLVHEAWTAEVSKEEVATLMDGGLTNHPRRKEVVCFRFEDVRGTCRILIAPVEARGPLGRKLGSFVELPDGDEEVAKLGGFFTPEARS